MRTRDRYRLAAPLGLVLAACSSGDASRSPGDEPASAPPRAADAARFERTPTGDLAVRDLATSPGLAARGVAVELPGRADGALRMRDRRSGVRVEFRLSGARPVAGVPEGERVVYPAAGPTGGDVEHRPGATRSEDFVTFPGRPDAARVRYVLATAGAAGLRLVANTLEVLDEAGTPRLRMLPPYLVAQGGVRHDARVVVEDCAVDRDARGPWRRPVTPPGRPECTVRVEWSAAVQYPAVLDPAWTTTDTLTVARRGHTATLLEDGTVLVAGGERGALANATYAATADLFDPDTGTFAATAALGTARSFHTAVRLASGDVLVAGGVGTSGTLGSAELYDAATPGWKAAGSLIKGRSRAVAVALDAREMLITGGVDSAGEVLASSELYDGARWTAGDLMSFKRVGHYMTTLPTGQALVVAGSTTTATDDVPTCEFYRSGAFASAPALVGSRFYFGGAMDAAGTVVVSGGYERLGKKTLGTTEVYTPSQNRWATSGNLANPRMSHTMTALAGGAFVAAGGAVRSAAFAVTSYLKSTELFDPASGEWSDLPDLAFARADHTATLLDDGRVLVAGGQGTAGALDDAELLSLDADGTECEIGATCRSGFCVDGVCCESACDETCQACSRTETGDANGTCSPASAGRDPHGDCKDDGAPACDANGFCDGAGACDTYAGADCTPSACAGDDDCTSGHCADGVCCDTACDGECEACTDAKKGEGGDGACGPVAEGDDPDGECPLAGEGTCRGDGVCDGARACRVPAAGDDCAAASCASGTTLEQAAVCAADGTCGGEITDCSPFRCAAAKCTTTCAKNTDCAPGATCKSGTCEKSPDGAACSGDEECTSGFCTDGVCCGARCDGQCEACDIEGSEGDCAAVEGAPHGDREPCTAAGETCGGECNGLARTNCIYPGVGTLCGGEPTCEDGVETADRCNSIGGCAPTPVECDPYVCGESACKTACESDDDCANGRVCRDDGLCELPGEVACDGGATADGGCAGEGGSKDDGGCGCRTPAGAPSRGGSAALLIAGLAAALARRSRRAANPGGACR